MNINNLEVGQVLKNYKVLCETLNEKVKTGGAKKLQVEDWERYFSYKRSGNSFEIIEILETPKPRVDGRSNGNSRVKYIDKIETLLLDLLTQSENKGKVVLSKNKLLVALSMVNKSYVYGRFKPHKLSKMINIDVKEIIDFYETSNGMLTRNLKTAIENLKKRSLISCNTVFSVCHLEMDETEQGVYKNIKSEYKDSYGDETVEFGIRNPSQRLSHRLATEDETALILEVQRDMLDKYEVEELKDIFKTGKHLEFFKDVRDILFDRGDIYFYYDSYEIIFNPHHILEESRLKNRKSEQSELNGLIVDNIISNASKRNTNAEEKYKKTHKEVYKMRWNPQYLDNSYHLTSLLIDIDSKTIYI